MLKGETLPDMVVGDPDNASVLAPLLGSRARLLAQFAADDSVWA